MKRLFIADPALIDHKGHHYSVTDTFSRAVEDKDIEAVWLVNRNYSINFKDQSGKRKVELTFSQGTYDGYVNSKSLKKSNRKVNKRAVSQNEIVESSSFINFLKVVFRKLPDTVQLSIRHMKNVVWELKKSIILYGREPQEIVKLMAVQAEPEMPGAADELYQVLKKYKCTSNDRVFFHTCDAHTYMDLVTFFTKKASIDEWNKLPAFYLSTPYDDKVMPHNKTCISSTHSLQHLESLGLIGTRIFLYAENELLAKYLSELWFLKVQPLHIPHQPIVQKPFLSEPTNILNVCYLGAARTEKGFVFVADAIESYLLCEERNDIRFTLQVSPQIMGYTPEIVRAINRLKLINDNRLKLIEHSLLSEEYQESIVNADVLLLCYEKERYVVRSSGIVVEALANGKNVIATKGTFPHYLAGNAGIGVENIQELVDGINRIADNRQLYKKLALERQEKYLAEHSSSAFLNAIFSTKPTELLEIDFCMKYITSSVRDDYSTYSRLL